MNAVYHRAILVLWLSLAIVSSGSGQKLRLNAYGSYVLDGTYHIYFENGDFYEGKINHGIQLGLGMEYMVAPSYGIELSSLRRCTNVFPEGVVYVDRQNVDLQFNYLLLGLNAYPQTSSGELQPYGGASAGIIIQSATNWSNTALNRAIVKFAWAARIGGVYWVSSRIGLKLQAQWLSSLQFKNGEVNFDVHRTGLGPADYSIANQLEMGSGLVIKIGRPAD